MVIRADDELRHPHTSIPEWRESMWYCFDIPEQEMGGALYYSYMPNAPEPFARLIMYLTKGWNTEPNTLLYHFDQKFPIPQDEWDNLDVGGIARFRRIEPLKRWELSFDDGKRLQFNLDVDLFAGNWHYIDNIYETPKFLAGDRYHRPFAAAGSLTLDGTRYAIDVTGDSDHSWGPRLWGPLYKSKYIAGQCGRDWAFQLMEVQLLDGGLFPYGYVWDGEKLTPITKLEITPFYDEDGLQRSVVLNIVDDDARLTRIEGTSFCSAPTEFEDVWNNDTYFNFDVDGGKHHGSGILSFYWNRDYYHRVMRRSGEGHS
jgi:hypothetical protein